MVFHPHQRLRSVRASTKSRWESRERDESFRRRVSRFCDGRLSSKRLQRNALRVQHARDVMVGDDEEVGGCAKGCVGVGEETRVNVTVRRDDGQRRDSLI